MPGFGGPLAPGGGFLASDPTSPTGAGWSTGFTAGSTLPIEPTLPSWLPTDPNSQNSELMDQYGAVNNFGANKAARAIDRTSAINKSMGLQAANNAAADYSNRILQAGGTALATGAVKAQAMLPVLRDASATQERKQMMLMNARKEAAGMRQNLAGAISQSRNQYLGMLAGTYTTMRGQNVQYQASGAGQGTGGGTASNPFGVGYNGQPFSPGYIPNQGSITPSSGWYGANNNNVLLDPTIAMARNYSPSTSSAPRR